MSDKIPITADGLAQLAEELRHLKNTARPEVIRAIAQARERVHDFLTLETAGRITWAGRVLHQPYRSSSGRA